MSKCLMQPATLCIAMGIICDEDVFDVVRALVSINERAYANEHVTLDPTSLRWVPDPYGSRATMHDVRQLAIRGHGSCHELAAAYAAWLRVVHGVDAQVVVVDTGPRDWHVVAVVHGSYEVDVYDPMEIGAR